VQEQLTLYREMAEGRFGPLRSAESAPIENEEVVKPINDETLDDMKALFGGGK
jgi:hypothetical protein